MRSREVPMRQTRRCRCKAPSLLEHRRLIICDESFLALLPSSCGEFDHYAPGHNNNAEADSRSDAEFAKRERLLCTCSSSSSRGGRRMCRSYHNSSTYSDNRQGSCRCSRETCMIREHLKSNVCSRVHESSLLAAKAAGCYTASRITIDSSRNRSCRLQTFDSSRCRASVICHPRRT